MVKKIKIRKIHSDTMCCEPLLVKGKDGELICICQCDGPEEPHKDNREYIFRSYDNGETWTEDYVLDHRVRGYPDMGYPCSVELADGAILTVYYQPHPETAHPCVQYAKWRLNNKALLND